MPKRNSEIVFLLTMLQICHTLSGTSQACEEFLAGKQIWQHGLWFGYKNLMSKRRLVTSRALITTSRERSFQIWTREWRGGGVKFKKVVSGVRDLENEWRMMDF